MDLATLNVRVVISLGSESRKALTMQVNRQRFVTCHQDIQSKVELFATDDERVLDVSLNDIGLVMQLTPLRNCRELIQQEYSLPLRF